MVALLVVLTILLFVTIDYFVQRRRGLASVSELLSETVDRTRDLFGRGGYRVPNGVFFDPGHTWMFLEETGTARVGIDDFAQALVGDFESIEAAPEGREIHKGEVMVTLNHRNRSVPFRSPVDGVIERVNTDLLARKELLSVEPQVDSWLFRIRPTNPPEVTQGLMIGQTAREWLSREIGRMKVFLSTLAPQNMAVGTSMADGGLPAYGLIDYLSDDEWTQVEHSFFVQKDAVVCDDE